MNLKKIIKQLKEFEKDYQSELEDAFDSGYLEGSERAEQEYRDGFDDGIKAERTRVIELFKMLAQQELVNGSGTKAKAYAIAADTVDIANHMEGMDWSEEGIEKAYQEELEKDGF